MAAIFDMSPEGSLAALLRAAEDALDTDPAWALAQAEVLLAQASLGTLRARALYLSGSAHYGLGQLQSAHTLLLEAFEAASRPADALAALLALGRVLRDSGKLEQAAAKFADILSLAQTTGDLKAEASALNLQASIVMALGDSAHALELLERALKISQEGALVELQASILTNLGSLHTSAGAYSRGLECLTAAYDIIKVLVPGTRTEALNRIDLGILYREMGETARAKLFFQEARHIGESAGDALVEAVALNNLANIAMMSKDYAAARDGFEAALSLSRQLGSKGYEIDNLDGLGQAYAALGEHAQALVIHKQTLEIARSLGDAEGEMDALCNLGRDCLALGQPQEALALLLEGLTLAREHDRKPIAFRLHEALATAYEQLEQLRDALEHTRHYHRLEREVFNEESERRTRQLTVQFDLERARFEAEEYRLRTEVAQAAREEAEAKVRERTRDLEAAQLEIATRLAVAAEYRDDETGEHTRRVGRNAALIARALGWPEEEVKLIFSAARLHDVGKIGIRDAVLHKPGKLDDEELEWMRQHTLIGTRILSGGHSRLLRMAEEIALAHHERWDGQGYPRGLAGERIPLAARIVAVADVLDALTHSRPYKGAWTVDDTLAEIEAQSGQQFDPQIVAATLRVFGTNGKRSPLEPSDDRLEAPHLAGGE